MRKDLINKLDNRAKKEYKNRSELIRDAARQYIGQKDEWNALFAFGEK
jgi:metal-responsive CopG/Arc/MetJ family transcriptional regulator